LTAKGVQVRFVKHQLTFTGEDTVMANLLLSVMGAFAEFERSLTIPVSAARPSTNTCAPHLDRDHPSPGGSS